ncbi:MAG: arylesterase [Gammaproteobacteria bacterium]
MIRFLFVLAASLFSASGVAGSIVVLGDSISAAYGIEVDQGWVNRLQIKLREEGKDYTIFNESISGDTTAGGLARIDAMLELRRPDVLILELGANDGLRGLSPVRMKSNLAEIIRRSKDSGAHVLLLGMRIPPNYGRRYTEMFYEVYPQLAKELDILYVPFLLDGVALEKKYMQHDGLHPNAQAQELLAEKIWQFLAPLLGQN